jgi:hypothetical protein
MPDSGFCTGDPGRAADDRGSTRGQRLGGTENKAKETTRTRTRTLPGTGEGSDRTQRRIGCLLLKGTMGVRRGRKRK